MTRANADLFKGQKPHVAVWGQSNRLLTGPFPNAAEARVFVNKLKKSDADHFVSDCPMAADQIVQDLDDHQANNPMSLLRSAYGI